MYAILKDGTHQYKICEGARLKVEKKEEEPGTDILFSDILFFADGENIRIGNPFVQGVKAKGKILEHGQREKKTAIKFRKREGYRKKQGQRPEYTLVEIEQITRE